MPNNTLIFRTFLLLFLASFTCSLHAANVSAVASSPNLTAYAWGTFESPALPAGTHQPNPPGTGWSFAGPAGFASNNSPFTQRNPNAPQGSQVLYVKQICTITRSLSLTPGTYRLRLKMAQRGIWQPRGARPLPENQTFQVLYNGEVVAELHPNDIDYTEAWTVPFRVNSGVQTLQIKGLNPAGGDNTALVDDVQVERMNAWSESSTWVGGSVPGSIDNVTIPANATVVMDQWANMRTLTVQGKLHVCHNKDINLSAQRIIVESGTGLMEWGRANTPYLRRSVITLSGQNPLDSIPGMGAKVLGVRMGATLSMHGAPLLSWTQLDVTANPNATSIHLKEAVNWRVNDSIVIVSSRINQYEAEKRKITGISGDKRTVFLNAPLQKPHLGIVNTYNANGQTWEADLRAEVGLLTHNITIQGANPGASGFGGHIMLHTNAKAYISGIELFHMGQKGKLGRYPFHWHLLEERAAGQYLRNSSIHKSFNRAVTIHGTESTLVENNFIYDHIGHGIFLEDGSERFNVIRKNVALLSKRPAPGEELTPSDNQLAEVQNQTPSTYWITNPENTFEDNVAAGSQGTGFWFAFPESPLGESASIPRFSGMEPHKGPLISFKGNRAHSCSNGFDVFDRLDANHSILPNRGWDDDGLHLIENCTWYGNWVGIYTGTGAGDPTDNLIFRDNIFFGNHTGSMLASNSIIDSSLFAFAKVPGIYDGIQRAYWVYDGPGEVYDCHFEDWDDPKANLLAYLGASIKHVNHLFSRNTTNHGGPPNIELPNFDLVQGPPSDTDLYNPSVWSHVLRDLDGSLTGQINSTIVGNHPFQLVGDENQPSNWVNAYRSNHKFALCRMKYVPNFHQDIPDVVVTREKAGSDPVSYYYDNWPLASHQLPMIVNEGYEYTFTYEKLPLNKIVPMQMLDATSGDDYIVRFTDFGKLSGIRVTSPDMAVPGHGSLASLRSSNSSGHYHQAGGDFYVKVVATGPEQIFNIEWNVDQVLPEIDTDGDQMRDSMEIQQGRNPFSASDLAAEFNNPGNFEGYTGIVAVSGASVSGGSLSGTSSGNGDAWLVNNAYNFQADEVDQIQVRMSASADTYAQFFFATASSPGFNAQDQVIRGYNSQGSSAWQVLTFDFRPLANWNGTITDLRLDPVGSLGINFDIDWIRAIGPAGSKTIFDSSEGSGQEMQDLAVLSPNPVQDKLKIQLAQPGMFDRAQLVDLQGRILKEAEIGPHQLQLKWNLDQVDLSEGIYLVRLLGTQQQTQIKVLKTQE